MAPEDDSTDELPAVRGAGGPRGAVAEPPLIAPGRVLGERYRLERRLGHGGMAVVWRATDERLGRTVAVKVLSDTLSADHDYARRFAREARVAAGLQHPNLVSVYDYDAGERPYLVMELIEGGNLAELLAAGEAPPPELIAEELLAALRHIHAAGVLHRDIKPQNVLIDGYGHARLTDFGIARPANGASFTRTGEVIGTESYLAPEVVNGAPASERSDLFALGVVLADAARDGADARLLDLAERLRDPDPDLRPQSASAALDELEAVAAVAAAPPGEATRPFTPTPTAVRRPRRWLIPALAAIVVIVGVTLALALGGSDDGSPGDSQRAAKEAGKPGDRGGGSGRSQGPRDSASGVAAAPAPAPAPEPEPQPPPEPAPEPKPAGDDGVALNDEGFALVNSGRAEEAVPVLERAVDSLRGSGDDATYHYALYNLATAYLAVGQPGDAIPLLEERMGFDDGQLAEVEATLDRAYAQAGVAPAGGRHGGNDDDGDD